MDKFVEELALVLLMFAWFSGVVLAKGFVSTAAAIMFPPWAIYLFMERALQAWGWA